MHSTPEEFELEQIGFRSAYATDRQFEGASLEFFRMAAQNKYTYTWNWMGLPVIQFPTDLMLMHDLIWQIKPSVIIETGIARGGSLAFYASMLQLTGGSLAIGVDIQVLPSNRERIETHPLAEKMRIVEGSSVEASTFAEVKSLVGESAPVLVVLDSNHEHRHVLAELEIWTPLVTRGSYCVVFDTTCARLQPEDFNDLKGSYDLQDWGHERNPATAVLDFIQEDRDFSIDASWHERAMITNCWGGFLRRRD